MCFRGCTCGPCEETREQDRGYKAGQNWRDYRSQTSRQHKLRRYGLTEEQLRALEVAQGDLCAVCGQPETAIGSHGKVKSLAIDHCHKTGLVRGLLCNNCNRAIGLLGDSADLLLKAVEYLKGGK